VSRIRQHTEEVFDAVVTICSAGLFHLSLKTLIFDI
jgi:hypothetical protein